MTDFPARIQELIADGCTPQALAALRESAELSSAQRAEVCVLQLNALVDMGRWAEAVEMGLGALPSISASGDASLLYRTHGHLGTAYRRLGNVRKAEIHYRAGIHILTWQVDDQAQSLLQQRRLALMFKDRGLWAESRAESEKGIAKADELGILRESVGHRINLALVLVKSGKLADSQNLLDQLELLLSSGDGFPKRRYLLLLTKLIRGNYLRITGHPARALEILEPALAETREGNYGREEAICLEYMGDCYLEQKDARRALDHYENGMAIAERTAPRGDLVPELCHRLAEAKIQLGQPNEAVILCERGLGVARELGDRYEECATHRVLATAQRASGNPRKALRVADEGVELGRSYEIPYELGRTLAFAGEARLQETSFDEQATGRQQIWEARRVFEQIGLPAWVRAMDRMLGLEDRPEPSAEEPGLAPILGMPELDRGALRYGIVTCDFRVREAISIAQGIGPSTIPVVITGESGVGKELLAHVLHEASDRKGGPFVPVNCGAVTLSLMESEFFGHERGAFTGAVSHREGLLASADKGTLFLDEVSELPSTVQVALLRVLETGEFRPVGRDEVRTLDIRIIAATNGKLEDAVARGSFRQDLFYRLNGVHLILPPLRDREDDIRALFRYFWEKAMVAGGKRLHVTEDVEAMLRAYHWPGNVRELKHEVARVVALAPNGSIVGRDAFLVHEQRRAATALRTARERHEESMEEREQILTALRAHHGNKAEAARSLGGMKRTTLIYKIERLGIRPEEYRVKK